MVVYRESTLYIELVQFESERNEQLFNDLNYKKRLFSTQRKSVRIR